MKTVIYKYQTGMNNNEFGAFVLELPYWSTILSVEMQNNELCIWARHGKDTSNKKKRYFYKVATGEDLPSSLSLNHIGTVHSHPFVSHIFERIGIESITQIPLDPRLGR